MILIFFFNLFIQSLWDCYINLLQIYNSNKTTPDPTVAQMIQIKANYVVSNFYDLNVFRFLSKNF
jgi:hypothetical protein